MSAAEPSSSRSAIAVIRDLQSGAITASTLSAPDRRRCIEHLTIEGYSIPEIAEVLKVSERTVIRDRVAIKEANALKVGPNFAGEVAGNLLRQAEASMSRLRRLGRDRETPPSVRVEAERYAWLTARETVETLQRLGYLPTAPQRVEAELTTHGAAPGIDEQGLRAELARLEMIVSGASVRPVPALESSSTEGTS